MADRVPQMLPPDVSHFTDREAELGTLDALLVTAGPAVVITAIAGTAGMGKTSLAVRWAHRIRDHFPDGQLYVNLRGYDPGPAVTPEQALDGFLRALNVPGEAIPHHIDSMAAYYRSLVAGRRMLVILDNAATADQVRPLLPASEPCVVLITSRSRLSGLVARDGAHRITLDLLPPDEAIALLRSIIGENREPDALAELARRCAYLPLALRIAAERITARPNRLIADLVADLTAEQDRLNTLAADDDETTAVRAVFSWSYRALTPAAARLFRLLGLHPGPEISVPVAVALAGNVPTTVRRLLDMLAGVHLLEEIAPDRYTFHDLLRVYAAELAHSEESEMDLADATERMFEWYLHTAHAASRVVWPNSPRKPVGPPGSGCHPLAMASHEEALGWLDREFVNLMATIHHAAAAGWHAIAWQLPVVLGDYFYMRSRWSDEIEALEIGLTAARHIQDPLAEYWALTCLAEAHCELEQFDTAARHAKDALPVARRLAEPRAEAVVLHDIGSAYLGFGRFVDAIDHFRQALAVYRRIGDRRGQGIVLSLIGDTLRRQELFDQALSHARQAIAILHESDNRWNEAAALTRLGRIYLDLCRFSDAIETHERALLIYRDLDSTHEAAQELLNLGEARHGLGDVGKARQCWEEALGVFEELNSPRAAEVRARLDRLGG